MDQGNPSSGSQSCPGGFIDTLTASYTPVPGPDSNGAISSGHDSRPVLNAIIAPAPGGVVPQRNPTDSAFSRHDSLLTFDASPSRNASELKSLLGNSSSRLKPGAIVSSIHTPTLDKEGRKIHTVSLEQAKPRARVEVDIALESDRCVEGGYMRGSVKIRVRRRHKTESPVLLAEGKVRVLGFECLSNSGDHYTFYQRSSLLSSITDAYSRIFTSDADSEGYSRAMEGVYVIPFAMMLSADDLFGKPKGAPVLQSGLGIRFTSREKGSHSQDLAATGPSVALASAPRPVQAAAKKNLGNGGEIRLTAALHRMTWVAGQQCSIRVWVINDSKKSIKTATFTLVRTTTTFRPRPDLSPGNTVGPDCSQRTTTHKVVALSVLERAQPVTKGHASAEGWWWGIPALQEAQFAHHLLIPHDALSVSRSRFIEVEYSIRVSVDVGVLSPDLHVTLPVRVANFLSIDPMPSEPLIAPNGSYTRLIPHDLVDGTYTSRSSSIARDRSSTLDLPFSARRRDPLDSGEHEDSEDGRVSIFQSISSSSVSETSFYSSASSSSLAHSVCSSQNKLGNSDLFGDMGSQDEMDQILNAVTQANRPFEGDRIDTSPPACHLPSPSLESSSEPRPQDASMASSGSRSTRTSLSHGSRIFSHPTETRDLPTEGSRDGRPLNSMSGDGDRDSTPTPRLRNTSSTSFRFGVLPPSTSTSASISGSIRSSRALPLPPSQSSRMSDIPATISALEQLRVHPTLYVRNPDPPGTSSSGLSRGAALVASEVVRAGPARTPAVAVVEGLPSSACAEQTFIRPPRSARRMSVPEPIVAKSFDELPVDRPRAKHAASAPPASKQRSGTFSGSATVTDDGRDTDGKAGRSLVKGRITALEERLRACEAP
ncbi:uncharacterized protein BXZ73DRAFT_73748 [Epithele typhae]|uniref:uncharacterized protein n=1 Tax=Epithele typhae TaxID=378194 RepID=UPI002008996D|nr:uncharacterized protein BXZ73DRAFT_73748 [Epithele typhae]KAH9944162.1 hypothetical protein BXZ73DRAFT_73748 [Epithele typhae]